MGADLLMVNGHDGTGITGNDSGTGGAACCSNEAFLLKFHHKKKGF